ncbi:MAG: recombinase family protein [Armatimonadota bacterium]|nr:recombinase family protein [Armatimonadota bacterium]
MPAPNGKPVWTPSSIRDLLMNRRYIAEIEINKDNKGIDDLPEFEAYRIVPAPHEPLVSRELFELAQAIRKEKAQASPNRRGKPRSYSQNQCNRVYVLQGRIVCGVCGSSMTPHYTHHKPGGKRKTECYIHYYECAQQVKGIQEQYHRNRVLARVSESWIVEKIQQIMESPDIVEQAMGYAHANCAADLQPLQESFALTKSALQENQAKIDEILATVSSGGAKGSLLELLNERANELKLERERLRAEQRRFMEALRPLGEYFDAALFRGILTHFFQISQKAEPGELQQILRLVVKRIEWRPDGEQDVEFYHLPKSGKDTHYPNYPTGLSGGQRFATTTAGAVRT